MLIIMSFIAWVCNPGPRKPSPDLQISFEVRDSLWELFYAIVDSVAERGDGKITSAKLSSQINMKHGPEIFHVEKYGPIYVTVQWDKWKRRSDHADEVALYVPIVIDGRLRFYVIFDFSGGGSKYYPHEWSPEKAGEFLRLGHETGTEPDAGDIPRNETGTEWLRRKRAVSPPVPDGAKGFLRIFDRGDSLQKSSSSGSLQSLSRPFFFSCGNCACRQELLLRVIARNLMPLRRQLWRVETEPDGIAPSLLFLLLPGDLEFFKNSLAFYK